MRQVTYDPGAIKDLVGKIPPDPDKGDDMYTCYNIAQIINKMTVEAGLTGFAPVTPQYIYSEGKKGKIAGKVDRNRYTKAEIEPYVAKWLQKRLNQAGLGQTPSTQAKPAQPAKK
jgi:hypothetical protein